MNPRMYFVLAAGTQLASITVWKMKNEMRLWLNWNQNDDYIVRFHGRRKCFIFLRGSCERVLAIKFGDSAKPKQ